MFVIIIIYVIVFQMSKQDVLPHKICENCLNYVNEWYKFRKKCMRNDIILKKYLSTGAAQVTQSEDPEKSKYCDINFQETESDGNILLPNESVEARADRILGESSKSENKLSLPGFDNSLLNNTDLDKIENTDESSKPLLRNPVKKFKCPSCPDSFYYLKDLKLHRSVIHKAMRSEKLPLNDPGPMKGDDVKLEEASMRTRYEMKCCEKVFFSKARFRKHFNKKHPGEKPYMCETCGKKDFISEETLKRHKILHTGKYRCEICLKTFTCNAILIIHKRDKHENDKPFICDVCGKRFVTELLMNYHKRFHTGEKKYVCEECGLAVVTSSSLAKHKRIHSNVKPHVCQVCGKGFIIKGRLVEHLRVHTGERPYSCHICHKGFTMRDKLKRHIRIHSGEKLFSCEYCGNNYSTSYGLTVHLKSHIVRNY